MPAEGPSSLTERVLRRDRWVVAGGLAVLTLLAWAYILAGAGMGMPAWHMISVSLFPHRLAEMPMGGMATMGNGMWSAAHWLLVMAMWWVMMIAMMTPSAAPVILLYGRATRHAQAGGGLKHGMVPTAVFAAGYLVTWLAFSIAATLLMWALEVVGVVSPVSMGSRAAWLSASVLIAAGLYQFSPLKHACLRACRGPAEFLTGHWRPGAFGALRMGLEHGAFCVGCCWVLMLLLFVGGIMNPVWIAILSLLVVVEKIALLGPHFAYLVGAILIVWGVATLLV
jgi:predicted metal-binding membrane protein